MESATRLARVVSEVRGRFPVEGSTTWRGGVNKVILIGNLGADPELRYTPGGQAVCEMRLATNESWTDKSGQQQERTEWHRVVVWGKPAEICTQYLTKGQKLYVEGRLQTRTWDDKEGNKRYSTEIIGTDFMFLGGGGERGAGAGNFEPRASRGGGGGFRGRSEGEADVGGGAAAGGFRGRGGGPSGPGFDDAPPAEDYGANGGGQNRGGPGGGVDDDIPF